MSMDLMENFKVIIVLKGKLPDFKGIRFIWGVQYIYIP